MHELSVVLEVVKTVENFANENNIDKIDTLVLQIGELSSVIPQYVEECYPIIIDDSILKDTKLEIEILPGNALCKNCDEVFNVLANKGLCPICKGRNIDLLSGKEFFIKEIVVSSD